MRCLTWGRAVLLVLSAATLLFVVETVYLFTSSVDFEWHNANSKDATIDYTFYPTSEQVNRHLYELQEMYPNLLQVDAIGESHCGKPILACTVTSQEVGKSSGKPALLIIAQQHAREAISSQSALFTIEYFLENYTHDAWVRAMLDSRTLYVVPQVNPDGNDLFLSEDESLRSNARPSDLDGDGSFDEDRRQLGVSHLRRLIIGFKPSWMRATNGHPWYGKWPYDSRTDRYANVNYWRELNWVDSHGKRAERVDVDKDGNVDEDYIHGVDLNRNWEASWDEGISDIHSFKYHGPTAFSEPETRAVRDFVATRSNIIMAVDVHSGVNMFLWQSDVSQEESCIYNVLGKRLQQITETGPVPFEYGVGSDVLYRAYGTAKDWLYQQGMLAAVLELYRNPTGEMVEARRLYPFNMYLAYYSNALKFNPYPSQLRTVVENRKEALLYLMAAMPEVSITEATFREGQLVLNIANSGGIPVDLEISVRQGTKTDVIEIDQFARQQELALKVEPGDITVTLDPGSLVATRSREGEFEQIELHIGEDGVVKVDSGFWGTAVNLLKCFDKQIEKVGD